MSQIAIKGATTGTGVFTLESPATNTDRTLVLPDEAGTVLTSASNVVQKGVPAFSAYQSSAQSGLANATYVKITLDTEEFDTNSNFSSSRFTPTVAGYYQISGTVTMNSLTQTHSVTTVLHKNGSAYKTGSQSRANSLSYPAASVSSLVYLNGTTDYVELYAYGDTGGTWTTAAAVYFTFLNGVLVRAA